MGGRVVHARRGDRASYRPLQSAVTPSSDPLEVVAALLAVAPFRAVYAADLDAILGRGDHRATLRGLGERFPALAVWLDAGFSDAAQLEPWLAANTSIVPVIGSETLPSLEALAALLRRAPHAMLSLDMRQEQPLGPAALFADPRLWPQHVIVMSLDRVGAGQGPALARLRATRTQAPGKHLIAAGGVRDARDLQTLEAIGVHAVLLASAIHDGSLDRATLLRFLSG